MSFDEETTEEHERRITRCRRCRARIIFLATASGRTMPVDADSVEPHDAEFDSERHISHFATCTEPEFFRRRNR